MADSGGYHTVKAVARFLGMAVNTMWYWGSAGVIPVRRDPRNNYRLFALADLEMVRDEIERTGTYPNGWQRPRWPK
jgi:DNA-binding transcriptional MerR regulator